MKFGLRYASLGRYSSGPAAVELAQAAEAAGFDSIWTVEHVVVPHGYQSRYPYSPTGRMGSGLEDYPIPDPLIWLAYVASATRTIKLGTAILILPQRNPVVTAKEVATLDHLAGGGRVLLGIGVGWLAEEFAALGLPFADRGPRTDEYVAAMRALWSQECATFKGRFISFDQVFCLPRPPERSIPTVVAARRAGRLGDGYFPARTPPPGLLDEMRRAAEAAGRDPKAIEITVAAPTDVAEIEALARQGIARVAVPVSAAAGLPAQLKTPDDVLRYGKDVIARFRSSARRPGEARGREGLEGERALAGQDEVGHRAAHGRAEQDALAAGARRHVDGVEARHPPEQQEAVGGHRPQAGGLVDDLGVGHRGQHRHQRGADLVARLARRLLVEAGLLLGRARPQEAVGLGGGVVVAPADRAGHRRAGRLQAQDLALEGTHLDRQVEPGRGLRAPRAEGQHHRVAGDLAALEDHVRDRSAPASEARDAPVAHARPERLGLAGEVEHEAIRLDVRRPVDRDRAQGLLRDPRLHAPGLRGVEPARGVARLPLLPGHGRLQASSLRLGECQGERGAQPEVDADPRLRDHTLRQLAVEPHPRLGDLGEGSGDAGAGHRAQPAVGEAGGVAADGVALHHDAGDARPGEVVGGDHSHDSAADDHHAARGRAGHARSRRRRASARGRHASGPGDP